MQNHNLDDLIIEERPEKGKGKGILAIVVLLIAILIIAFIMTRIFLGTNDSNTTVTIEEKQEDMISPELQLDSSNHDLEADKKELDQLSSILEDELANKVPTSDDKEASSPIKPDTVQINESAKSKKPTMDIQVKSMEVEPLKQEPVVEKVVPKKPKPIVKPKPVIQKKPEARREAPVTQKPKASSSRATGNYYIQVGAFSKEPSSRFLSVITSSGFRYKLSKGKLLIGPYSNSNAARKDLPRVKDKINKAAFIKKI